MGCSSTFLTDSAGEKAGVSASGKNLREENELDWIFKKGKLLGRTFGRESQLLQSIHDSLLQPHRKDIHFSDEVERVRPSTGYF